jgi:hypothetical protein
MPAALKIHDSNFRRACKNGGQRGYTKAMNMRFLEFRI